MTPELKPYPAYKDSGVPWLGEVPEHWDVKPLRMVLKQRNEKNDPVKTRQILSLSIAHGVTLYSHEGRGGNKSKSDLTAYKIAHEGDIVLNSMNVIVGAVGLSKYTGAISPVYYALYPIAENVNVKYYDKVFSNSVFQRYLLIYGKGILIKESSTGKLNTIRMKISPSDLKQTQLALPPPDEQLAIVHYLDYMDRRIRRYIRNKQKLIKLLEEQKQAIIHQAVTGQIDVRTGQPYPAYKDSGVEWLGQVPDHWEVRRIFSVLSERKEYGEPELPILQVSIANGVTLGEEVDEAGRPKRLIEDRNKYKIARKGDISYNMMRMWQGAVGNAPEEGLISPAYVIAKPRAGVNTEYLVLLFRTDACKGNINSKSRGIVSDRNRLYWEGFKDLFVCLPPALEQDEIVLFTVNYTKDIVDAQNKAKEEISLLREYHTRLIADVVTGKLDVREAAVKLPDEPDEADEAEPEEGLEEFDGEDDLDSEDEKNSEEEE